jgi:hypothetical protein
MSARVGVLHQLKEHSPTYPLTYPLICKHPALSLSTSQEQGRTLELERERNEERIGGGEEEEEEKHQHLPMDFINLFNIAMVSLRE